MKKGRAMSVIDVSAVQVKADADVLNLAEYSSVESFLQKIFQKDKAGNTHQAAAMPGSLEFDEFHRTSHLIEAASQAIESLSSRCETLELEIEQEKANSREQLSQIETLKKMLLEFESMNTNHKNSMKAMTSRCQTAENRIAELEQAQRDSTLRASKAESISNKLQQQVEAAFGHGSPIRSVMEGVKHQNAAQ